MPIPIFQPEDNPTRANFNARIEAANTELSGKQNKLTGEEGQVVVFDENGKPTAQPAPATGVISFKGRSGTVAPKKGDYTAEMVGAREDTWMPTPDDVGAVPTTRKVNDKDLSTDISLTASDVGAIPLTMADSFAMKGDIAGAYIYRGSVASYSALPTTGLTAGDVYNVEANDMNYGWTGTAWDPLGHLFQLDYLTTAEIDEIMGE